MTDSELLTLFKRIARVIIESKTTDNGCQCHGINRDEKCLCE